MKPRKSKEKDLKTEWLDRRTWDGEEGRGGAKRGGEENVERGKRREEEEEENKEGPT